MSCRYVLCIDTATLIDLSDCYFTHHRAWFVQLCQEDDESVAELQNAELCLHPADQFAALSGLDCVASHERGCRTWWHIRVIR